MALFFHSLFFILAFALSHTVPHFEPLFSETTNSRVFFGCDQNAGIQTPTARHTANGRAVVKRFEIDFIPLPPPPTPLFLQRIHQRERESDDSNSMPHSSHLMTGAQLIVARLYVETHIGGLRW